MKTITLTDEQQKIFKAMEANPELAKCVAEMVDFACYQPMRGRTLDDAEEETIQIVQKSGKLMLQEWCQRSADEAAEASLRVKKTRPHEKKSSPSQPLLDPSS